MLQTSKTFSTDIRRIVFATYQNKKQNYENNKCYNRHNACCMKY